MNVLWKIGGSSFVFEPSTGLLRFLRGADVVPIAVIEDFRRQLPVLFVGLRQRVKGLLVDMRQVIGRNDPQFEQASAALLMDLAARVPRIAVLVETQVGLLHVQRQQRQLPVPMRGFVDEAEAVRFLTPPDGEGSGPK